MYDQGSGRHTEGQQVKAGWLGFSASIASGIGGCLFGGYVNTIRLTCKVIIDLLFLMNVNNWMPVLSLEDF